MTGPPRRGGAADPTGTLTAAVAVLLATTALAPLYDGRGWWPAATGAVAAVAAGGLLGRRLGLPAAVQPLLTLLVLADTVALLFARSTLVLGLLPGRDTWPALRTLLAEGRRDVELLTTPVPTHPGLVLLAALGVGLVAVAVDAVAVGARRPAPAGVGLLVLFAVPGAVLGRGVGAVPFLLTGAGWLLLLAGQAPRRSAADGPVLGRPAATDWSGGDDGRLGRRIGTAALGLAVVVPLLLPTLDSRLPGGRGGDGPGGPRTTTTYNPITRLRADLRLPTPRPILTYRTDDPEPDYLRLTTLDRFTGGGWAGSRLTGSPRRDGVQRPLPPAVGAGTAPTRRVTSTVAITGLQAQWLPAPAVPSAVEVPGPWLYDRRSETVFSIRSNTQDLRRPYRVRSTRVLPDRDAIATARGALPAQVAPFAVPPGLSGAVVATTRRVVRGARTDYDRVVALQAFFLDPRNGFVYDTSPDIPALAGTDALSQFLVTRRGFCEQYSSAMAAMVRQLGIPARVAVGFTAGTRQPDGSYAVTTSDAHSWPEVWFAGAGWVRFEPTPRGDGQARVPDYSVPAGAARGTAPVPAPAQAPSPAPSAGGPAADGGPAPDGGLAAADPAAAGGGRGGTGPAVWLAAALALLALPALAGAARRRRRHLPGPAAAEAAWRRLQEDATDVGAGWSTAWSPRVAAARLQADFGLDAAATAALADLVRAVEQARYAPRGAAGAPPDPRSGRLVRAALLAGAGRSRRWRARLLPPATLRWAWHGAGAAAAAVVDGADRAVGHGWARLRRLPAALRG